MRHVRESQGNRDEPVDGSGAGQGNGGDGSARGPAWPGIEARPAAEAAKSRLSTAEMDSFRRLLLEIRHRLAGVVDNMEKEAMRKNRTDAAGDLSLMPIHMADIGTDAYEQEFTIGLIENSTETLREIDAALERIQNGTYGICQATQKPIGKARLKVMPWARYCVAHERAEEARRDRRR